MGVKIQILEKKFWSGLLHVGPAIEEPAPMVTPDSKLDFITVQSSFMLTLKEQATYLQKKY